MIKCGFSEIVITPRLGLNVPGYFDPRPADGIKDDLYARAFVVESNETAAFVVVDVLFLTAEHVKAIRAKVCGFTGIPELNVMVSATHSHTASPTDVADVMETICSRAADAVIIAYNNRKDALLGYGIGFEQTISFNRRYHMKNGTIKTNPGLRNPKIIKTAGVIDPSVNVIRVDNPDGSPMGLVVNFACHLDVVGDCEYSADYPGEMIKILKKVYGKDIGCVFMTGCCGDINHIDFTGKIDTTSPVRYKQMGRILAGNVIAVREKIFVTTDLEVSAKSITVKAPRRQPTAEQIEWSKSVINAKDDSDAVSLQTTDSSADVEYIAAANTRVVDLLYANDMIYLHENPIYEADVEISAVKIGDTAIVGLPGEIFVDIGLNIKNIFKNAVVTELANGCHGYIGTKKAHEQGSYEVRLNRYTYLAAETEDIVTDNALKILQELS